MTTTLHRNIVAARERMSAGAPRRRCGEPAGAELLHAMEQFNRREFFECHETLEELWLAEADDIRYLYQGILQVGVGYLHLLRGNHHGAVTKLHSGCALLEYFGDRCLGIDVTQLLETARMHEEELRALGAERIAAFNCDRIPTIALARTAA